MYENEPAPLSLELRTLKKRSRQRVGVALLVVGVAALVGGVVAFLTPGAALFGVYGSGAGVALSGVGIYLLRKAATSRW